MVVGVGVCVCVFWGERLTLEWSPCNRRFSSPMKKAPRFFTLACRGNKHFL